MTEIEKAKLIASQAADELLGKTFDDDEFKVKVAEVKEKYEAVVSLDPNDLDAQFNVVFFMALGLKLNTDKHLEAMKILTGASTTALTQLAAAEMPIEKKQQFLADYSIRINKLISDFCFNRSFLTEMTLMFGSVAFDQNPHSSSWGISKFEAFHSLLDECSEDLIVRSLSFASEIIVQIQKLDLENKYACIAHIAKSAVYEAVKAPAFSYNDEFFDRHESLLRQMILVIKTSEPHEIYYVPKPYHFGQVGDDLDESYKHSKLKQMTTELNEEAEAEAISRYWETHPGEKEALAQEQDALKKELSEQLALKHEKSEALKSAEAAAAGERDALLKPEEEKLHKAEEEIQSLNKQLSALGLFQGKQKKALRAEIETKQLALCETEILLEELKGKAEAAYEEKLKEPNRQFEEIKQKVKALDSKLNAIQKKLKNPLDQ